MFRTVMLVFAFFANSSVHMSTFGGLKAYGLQLFDGLRNQIFEVIIEKSDCNVKYVMNLWTR